MKNIGGWVDSLASATDSVLASIFPVVAASNGQDDYVFQVNLHDALSGLNVTYNDTQIANGQLLFIDAMTDL